MLVESLDPIFVVGHAQAIGTFLNGQRWDTEDLGGWKRDWLTSFIPAVAVSRSGGVEGLETALLC